MTQLSNVPMQPNPSAVERPLTLIEKLEQARDNHNYYLKTCGNDRDKAYHSFGKKCYQKAIDIVKQHNEWVSVNERLPDKFWNDDQKYYCRVDTMGCIEFKILVWRYGDWHNLDLSPLGQKGFTIMPKVTHYFELPQSPSEVQDD